MTPVRFRLLPVLAVIGLLAVLPAARATSSRPHPAIPSAPFNLAAARLRSEISTAIFHAALAEAMENVAGAHLHLHHVINCLVAPSNPHFDPHVLEPCRGLGHGALNDAPAGPVRVLLAHALTLALRAEASRSFPQVHALAGRVRADLVRARHSLNKH